MLRFFQENICFKFLLNILLKTSRTANMFSGFVLSIFSRFWKISRNHLFLQERRDAQGKQHQHHRRHVKVVFRRGNCLFSWTMTFRRVREARTELRKFIRESKKVKTQFCKSYKTLQPSRQTQQCPAICSMTRRMSTEGKTSPKLLLYLQ